MRAEIPFRSLPIDQSDVWYRYGPDSTRLPDVRAGVTTKFESRASDVYPDTIHSFWVHVPARYEPNHPARVAVFNDGWWYLDPDGEVRGGLVLDNLIDRGLIPVTIGVFVEPGTTSTGAKNRNIEYDAFDERYVTFLTSEILPQVSSRWSISDRPEDRLICGGSSGGNCAFTAAWLRPEAFGHVIAYLSSFAQMPGGNPYPALIPGRRKPLKIFLQAGHRDLGWNRAQSNWLAENLRVAAALAEAGYDFRLVLGDGGHNPNHGGVLLPDALRWHWSDQADL